MSAPISGPVLDDLASRWIDGDIPAGAYLKQARRLARESARRDLSREDDRRANGSFGRNGAVDDDAVLGHPADDPPGDDRP